MSTRRSHEDFSAEVQSHVDLEAAQLNVRTSLEP
jgi:hypothetical protein